MLLREHTHTVCGERVTLRPMTENDWATIAEWETDREVIWWADSDPITSRTIQEVQEIFRTVSQNAYCFVIELEDNPIGDCWLQRVNLKSILEAYPGKDCRRIDLVIGKKALWSQGLGTDVIRSMTRFAFDQENADVVFGIVGDYNGRSERAFRKAGFKPVMNLEEPPTSRAEFMHVLAIHRP